MPPGRFLSDAEIERLQGWPETIERRDVVRFFAPAGEDLEFVREQRGAANQVAAALQLGALRWLGFVPEDLAAAPPEAITTPAETLDVPARAIFDYAVRAQTRGEHRLLVRAYARFRPSNEPALDALGGRDVDAALEHERPSLLLVRLCEILRADRVKRPSVDRLVRLVGWTRERAHERTFERLAPQLTDRVRAQLDGLLLAEGGRCGYAWLISRPTSVSARALRRELEKRSFLIGELGAGRFDLQGSAAEPSGVAGADRRQQTNQALSRMTPDRRYPVLIAFCVEALERTIDDGGATARKLLAAVIGPPGGNGTRTYAKPPGRARVAGGVARRRAYGAT